MLSGFDGLRFTHWQADIRDDGIVVLALDRHDSPVNAMSQDVLLELGCTRGQGFLYSQARPAAEWRAMNA